MRNQNTPVAMEGIPFIAGFGGAALLLYIFSESRHSLCLLLLSLFALILAIFSLYFFRNPSRRIPAVEGGVVAPADGVVIYLGDAVEEHLGEEMTKISIFMSVFSVHINRAPVTGKIIDNFYVTGKFLDVRDERATFENERNGLVIETAQGSETCCCAGCRAYCQEDSLLSACRADDGSRDTLRFDPFRFAT